MSGVNKAIILGRLGRDPEIKTLAAGTMVANFTVATSEVFKDKTTGERKETTDWHNIVLWNQQAEIASKYLHKGDMVYIEGKLRTRSWEKDGVTRYTTEIIGNNITLLGGKSESPSNNNGAWETQPTTRSTAGAVPDATGTDDLPF